MSNYVTRLGITGIALAASIFAAGGIAEATGNLPGSHYVNGERCVKVKVTTYRAYPGHRSYRVSGCGTTPDTAPTAKELRKDMLILALPQWLHVSRAYRAHGTRCVTVYGTGPHGTSAQVCRNGQAFTS